MTTPAATPPAPAAGNTALTSADTPPADASAVAAPAAGATPPAAAAPADASKPDAGQPPAELQLRLPDGFNADDPLVGEFKAMAKAKGLNQEAAQGVMDLYVKAQQSAAEKSMASVAQQRQAWTESLKADKEIGGASFDANAQAARKAVIKYGTPALREFLDASGLGNHPELVRAFMRMGKAMSEDSIAGGMANGNANASNSEDALHRQLYPTMFKE